LIWRVVGWRPGWWGVWPARGTERGLDTHFSPLGLERVVGVLRSPTRARHPTPAPARRPQSETLTSCMHPTHTPSIPIPLGRRDTAQRFPPHQGCHLQQPGTLLAVPTRMTLPVGPWQRWQPSRCADLWPLRPNPLLEPTSLFCSACATARLAVVVTSRHPAPRSRESRSSSFLKNTDPTPHALPTPAGG
jgi:hypothetical protein